MKVYKIYNILSQQGLINVIRRSVSNIFERIVWRRILIKRLPTRALWYWFEFRSRVVPWVSDANPLRLLWVDPDEIKFYHSGGPRRFGHVAEGNWDTSGKVGDWDITIEPFEQTIIYQSLYDRFKNKHSWKQTRLYKESSAETMYKDDEKTQIGKYFEDIERLYYNIESNGYKSQRDLLGMAPERIRDSSKDNIHPALNEVGICIYRDGTLAKRSSGNHRLSIAKILNIDKIPVVVRVRHSEWQSIRDKIRQAESIDELDNHYKMYLDHPDITDIIDSKNDQDWR